MIQQRTDYRPAISFDQYVESRGAVVATTEDIAEIVWEMTRPQTARSRGQLRAKVQRMQATESLRREYDAAIRSGEIAQIAVSRRIDPDRESDQAWLRVQARRAVRRAQMEAS